MLPEVRSVRIGSREDAPETLSAKAAPVAEPAVVKVVAPLSRFDPRLTFEHFIVGDANRVACNAARAMGEDGPMRFSPLYLHGPTGHGKTHLLHAIGHAYMAMKPGAKALSMSAERFMVEFVQAIRAKDTMAFKERLRSVDLLMIDDFQFIAGKGPTQEEFLYTLDELMRADRRVVIAADRSPHELDGVEGRILSRLTQGLVVDIQPADYPLRRAIVHSRAAAMDAAVPATVLDLLASRIASSIRELEGGLNRLAGLFVAQQPGDRRGIRRRRARRHVPRQPPPHHDRRNPAARVRPFQDSPGRDGVRPSSARSCPTAADRDVSGKTTDPAFAARNRPPLWRTRSHDGDPRGAPDRKAARAGHAKSMPMSAC